MHQRLDCRNASSEAFKALPQAERQIHTSDLEESLLELVKSRAARINGCDWCLDMHIKDARAR